MTAIALLEVAILRPPKRRTSNSGSPYAMTTVVVGHGEEAEFWKVLVFGRSAEDLLSLRNGDRIEVTGPPRAELMGPVDAPTGIARSIVAENWTRGHAEGEPESSSSTPRRRGRAA